MTATNVCKEIECPHFKLSGCSFYRSTNECHLLQDKSNNDLYATDYYLAKYPSYLGKTRINTLRQSNNKYLGSLDKKNKSKNK